MAFKKYFPKNKKRVYKKRVYKKKTIAKPSIKMMIKKALDRRIENKTVTNLNNLLVFQSGTTTIGASSVTDITPSILNGTGESGRIGNTCKLKNAYLRGFLQINSSGTNGVNIYQPGQFCVRLFVGKLKDTNDIPTTADFNTLLRSGGATYGFDSRDPLSLMRQTNKDHWNIYHDKIYKIGVATHSTGQTTGFSMVTGVANNDYRLNYFIKLNLTKAFKKTLIFNDSSPNVPTNTACFMFAGIVDAIGSDTLHGLPVVVMPYDIEYSYEDA